MIDSHTHLNMQEDPIGCIKRAREAGLRGILTIGTKMRSDTPEVAPLCAANPGYVWRTIGTHPGEVHHEDAEQGITADQMIAQIEREKEIIGVGETGLDPTYDHVTREQQERSLRKHIDVALAVDKPIILHTRQAESDTLAIVREYPRLKGIFHCFTGDLATAQGVIDAGLYVSFSGILTYPKSQDLRDVAAVLPANKILIETDAPYLSPVPHRGKNNEPAYVLHTLEVLAKARNASYADLGAQMAANFRTLFNV